jgi:catechol 2,3-dioxygenase-like lactoylglutathione lyase family enzyme
MELNHVAVFVDSLEDTSLPAALGGWGAPAITITDQPVTVGGKPGGHSGRTRRVRTAVEPPFGVSIEDVAPDAPIQPEPGNAWHHIAVWCDDVRGSVAALEANGYRRDVVGRDANGELATFAYMVSDMGPRVEVSDAAMRAGMLAYHARTVAAEGIEVAPSDLSAPLAPVEVAVVVDGPEELERLRACWRNAFDADWGEVRDSVVKVTAAGASRELRLRSVSTRALPCVTILASAQDSRALLAPLDGDGWHHVTFRSADLAQDVAAFRRAGFGLEFCDPSDDGSPRSFAMLVAPEGTRVKLIA